MNYAPPNFEHKICPPSELLARIQRLPKPLVFTNGCFDILHRGHVSYLAQAAALGQSLVVAINSDASVKRLDKGADRPYNTLNDRAAVLAALAAVDLVTWFEEDTPIARIETIVPDILVKGGDWPPSAIVGAPLVLANGGSVHSIPFLHITSTTAIVDKIRHSLST